MVSVVLITINIIICCIATIIIASYYGYYCLKLVKKPKQTSKKTLITEKTTRIILQNGNPVEKQLSAAEQRVLTRLRLASVQMT